MLLVLRMLRAEPRPPRLRPAGAPGPLRLAVALALIVGAILPGGSRSAGAAPIDDKRAEARRLEAAIEENGERISMLTEDYNEARVRIDEATAGIVDAERRLDTAKRESDQLRARVRSRAALLYRQAGTGAPLAELDADTFQEAGARAKYSAAAAERNASLVADLTVAREMLEGRRAELDRMRADAQAEEERLAAARRDVEAAQAEQQELLSQVEGEIAELVRQEEARRRAEAERRAREEMERRRQQEAAAREAAAREAAERETGGGGSSAPAPSTPPPNVPAPNAQAATAVATAQAQLGDPYHYGASGPDAFDCSGLTMYAWAAAGVGLPHSSRAQFASLPHVPMDALAPGDLVFYGSPIHHVGMYVGGGQMIHAPQTGDVVKYSSIYRSDFAGAARPG